MLRAFLLFVVAASPGLGWSAVAVPACAKVSTVLRKGPGMKHPASWHVSKYMPFMRTAAKSGWVKVEDLDGQSHWARATDVTTNQRCVVVKTNIATFRESPSAKAAPLDLSTVDRYTPFLRLGADRDWVQVKDQDGRKGWIHESQLWRPVKVNEISF